MALKDLSLQDDWRKTMMKLVQRPPLSCSGLAGMNNELGNNRVGEEGRTSISVRTCVTYFRRFCTSV